MSIGVGDREGEYKHFRKIETGRRNTCRILLGGKPMRGLVASMWQLV